MLANLQTEESRICREVAIMGMEGQGVTGPPFRDCNILSVKNALHMYCSSINLEICVNVHVYQ